MLLDAYEPPTDFVINQGQYTGVQPRKQMLPLFAGTSLFPSPGGGGGGKQSTTASSEAVPVAEVRGPSSPVGGCSSPACSPMSDATGAPKLSSLLSGGTSGAQAQAGGTVLDCAASGPSGLPGSRGVF